MGTSETKSFLSIEKGKVATMKNSDKTISPASDVIGISKTKLNCRQSNKGASFHSCEMVLGKLLGTGAFCDVHDLYDVRLLNCKELDQLRSPINEETERQRRKLIHDTCHDRLGKSRYVVKHLRPNLITDRGTKIYIHAAIDCLKEFDILSRLSHPNIVRLWGSAISAGNETDVYNKDYKEIVHENSPETFFIIIEKVEETLTQRILQWILTNNSIHREYDKIISDSEVPLPLFYDEKLRYSRDIASALAYVHSQGMVFRDLKPDNIGIASNGTAKLFDFGLCRDLPLSQGYMLNCHHNIKKEPIYRMSTVGTRRYMSPEMISGNGYNQKTDSYSWAMVFYEMLSLQKPYAKCNRASHKVLVCEKQKRPHVSADIPWNARDLLKRSWGNDVSDRPTMREICNRLEQMLITVEQQNLPLIERSLRAVLEMAELFGFGSENTLSCIASGTIPCTGDNSPTEYSLSPKEKLSTKLPVPIAAMSTIAV